MLNKQKLKENLEYLYDRYNKRELIHPDPLEFLYHYENENDIEVAALIASSLAYGKVSQILKSVEKILSPMGKTPGKFIISREEKDFFKVYEGFKHRFTTSDEIVLLLCGIKRAIADFGSLKNLFKKSYSTADEDYIKAATSFVSYLNTFIGNKPSTLLPSPSRQSACKRLMLFLKWMIRKDNVDIGCWSQTFPASKLIIPLDTHMYKIGKILKMTDRKSADLKTAIEITEQFKLIEPNDPAKYDFVLTRFGIRNDMNYHNLLKTLQI